MKNTNLSLSQDLVLIIGPSPPPFGGARVSFKLFFEFLINQSKASIKYFDLPSRRQSSNNQIGKVNHVKTLLGVLRSILSIPICQSVVIFGSRGFCFSYGMFICVLSRCFRKHCYIRFFGGRPVPYLKTFPSIIQGIVFWGLSFARRISIETKIGASEFPEFLQTKFEVIPGYRHRMPESDSSLSDSDGSFRFVYVGGISKEKGIEILLKSFTELQIEDESDSHFELHLYGEGSGYYLKKLLKNNGIYFHGIIDNMELRRHLASYDVFVFPSVYDNEGHPGVLIEALMAGLPIISTDQPVIREFLTDQFNCLFVQPGDVREMVNAMANLTKNHRLRLRLAEAALETSAMFDAANVLPVLAKTFAL